MEIEELPSGTTTVSYVMSFDKLPYALVRDQCFANLIILGN